MFITRWFKSKQPDVVGFSQYDLGRFAMDADEVQMAEDAILRYAENQRQGNENYVLGEFSVDLGDHNGYKVFDLIAISFFLMSRCNKKIITKFIKQHDWYHYVIVKNRLRQLTLITQHQNMHDYFEAGIWDINFIKQCIKDDIDSTLAISVYGGM